MKQAIVLGASSGMGRKVSEMLLKEGWHVGVAARRMEALNELAVLRDRFGGRSSRAIIVTSAPASRNRALMRMRAAELNIEVIELGDLTKDRLIARLKGEDF